MRLNTLFSQFQAKFQLANTQLFLSQCKARLCPLVTVSKTQAQALYAKVNSTAQALYAKVTPKVQALYAKINPKVQAWEEKIAPWFSQEESSMQRRLFAGSLLLIAVSVISTSTWAYYTTSSTATNVITMGSVDIAIIEQMVDADGTLTDFTDQSGVMPGAAVSKIVTIQNTGAHDAWVRVEIAKTMTATTGETLDADMMSFSLGENWMQGDDGYYYYTLSLSAGESTTALWETVNFSETMGNDYQGATGTVEITAYAVQMANNPIPDGGDVTDIAGW